MFFSSRWFKKYIQIDNASEELSELSRQSNYEVLPGDRFTDVDHGMAGILATLATQLPARGVRLSSPVKCICWEQVGTFRLIL